MTASYQIPSRRGPVVRLIGGIDDFMSWMLYGQETWLVALLKGVPLFLFVYFLVAYIPNYIYYGSTLYVLTFTKDVGFLLAALVGGGNFTAIIVMALWTQAARGRRGFGWSLIRFLDFFQYLFAVLIMIPWLVFNVAGGSLWPWIPPTVLSLGLGAISFVLGVAALGYLYLEYGRITSREAEAAGAASRAWSTGS
jgi:hypothetical protein